MTIKQFIKKFTAKRTKLLGFTPLAKTVNEATINLSHREGVHRSEGVEIASIYDLLNMCNVAYMEVANRYHVNRIRNWIKVFQWAGEADARTAVCHGYLATDEGQVAIAPHKRKDRPTYFIAIDDFPIYLEAVSRRHPTIGKRLKQGWDAIQHGLSGEATMIDFCY